MREGQQEDFAALVQRVQGGSEDAARELIARYGPHIIRIVRRKLSKQLRSKFDSVDFVQSVWASVFANRDLLAQLEGPEQMIAFLVTLARNKVTEQTQKRFQTQKRDLGQEQRLEGTSADTPEEVPEIGATPSQVAIANETWDRLLEGQPTQHREILVLRRLGNTHLEIAQKLGVNEKTVRRILNRLLAEQQP
jgi:RNA polymerase sigma-70 factor (ECF subfamily)